MKKNIFTLLGLILSASLFCQAPNSFNYQAVLRNSDGTVKSSESVEIQIEIIQGTIDGSTVYLETHSANTNSFGLVNLMIGGGETSDDISSVDWGAGLHFIRITIDGAELGTSQLLSVPYAMYAEKSGNAFSGDYENLTNVPSEFNPETHQHSEADIADLLHYTDEDIDGNEAAFDVWDKDAADDFDGQYTSLTGAPVNVSELNNDVGYLTSFTESDGDISNEIQDLQLAGNILTITRNGTATPIDLSPYLDNTDTQLTESEVDTYVANNGYLTGETDGSITNEIQDLQLSGNLLSITNNGTATIIDLSKYLDDTDTQLTESEVDAYIANNGYLTDVISVPIYTSGITNSGHIYNSRRIYTDSLIANYVDVDANINTPFLTTRNIINNEEITTSTLRSNDIEVAGRVNTSDLSSGNVSTGGLDAGWIGTGGIDVFGRIHTQELEVFGWTSFGDLNVNNSITSYELYVGGGNVDLGTDAIQAQEIEAGAIGASEILDGSIASADISDASISNVDLDKSNIPLSGFAAPNAAVNMGTQKVINLADPTVAQDAATKAYVDNTETQLSESEVDAFVSNNGYLTEVNGIPINTSGITNAGNMNNSGEIQTGMLRSNGIDVSGNINTWDLSASSVNTGGLDAGWIGTGGIDVFGRINTQELEVFGWTNFNDLNVNNRINTRDLFVSGIVDMGTQKVINLADPTVAQDAATKAYVDNTETQLSEAEVDAYVSNNGYLTVGADGSETVIVAGTDISISGTGTSIDPYIINSTSDTGSHSVGELYNGGVVFYTWADGQHGFIVSSEDLATASNWDNAVILCDTYSNDGFGGWRLPSSDELRMLFHHTFIVNKILESDGDPATTAIFSQAAHWTSTESSASNAYTGLYDQIDLSYASVTKGASYRVRAIREF